MRVGGLLDGARVLDVLDERGELVAAEPGRGVVGAQGAGDAFGDRDEQLVADGVAQGVVDDLEVVEVDEEDADDRAVPGAAGQGVLRAGRRRARGWPGRSASRGTPGG